MENIEKAVYSLKKIKDANIVFEKEDGENVYFFILNSNGEGFKTSVALKTIADSDGKEDELVSSLEYSVATAEDIEFFNLRKRVYTLLDQGAVVTLKKYINRIAG